MSFRRSLHAVLLSSFATVVAFSSVGCSGGVVDSKDPTPDPTPNPTPTTHEVRQSALPQISEDAADPTSLAAASLGTRRLGLDLLAKVAHGATPSDNTFLSPFSIASALALAHSGAVGDTEAAMKKVLGVEGSRESVGLGLGAIDARIKKGAEPGRYPTYSFSNANSIWADPSLPLEKGYLDSIATHFGAGVHVANLVADPEGSRGLINAWVEKNTQTRIKNLLPSGTITPQTLNVLVNAVHFKASWTNAFSASATSPSAFHAASGDVTVPFMHQSFSTRVARVGGKTAIALPYDTGRLEMIAIVGDAKATVPPVLSVEEFDTLVEAMHDTMTNLSMPKWKAEGETLDITPQLQERGLGPALTPEADFTGMSSKRPLFIGKVVHKTFVAVDEGGTEAAASTAVIMATGAAPGPSDPIVVNLDRPFVYAIVDHDTRAMLFVGEVTKPNG
ncbi:MAG: serpin family protein [Polyangiaceae bacterium]